MRLIDADALLDALDKSAIYGWSLQEDAAARRWAERVVELMPTIELEIIRCNDCKHSEHWYRDRRRCFLWSEDGVSVFDDGFCNYAERRTDA